MYLLVSAVGALSEEKLGELCAVWCTGSPREESVNVKLKLGDIFPERSIQSVRVCVCVGQRERERTSALSYRLNPLRVSVRTRNKWALRLKDCL